MILQRNQDDYIRCYIKFQLINNLMMKWPSRQSGNIALYDEVVRSSPGHSGRRFCLPESGNYHILMVYHKTLGINVCLILF